MILYSGRLSSPIQFIQFFLLFYTAFVETTWLPKEAAEYVIKEFENLEFNRSLLQFRGTDRRSSAPFISGDGIRATMKHICEDANRCRMDPLAVTNGSCVFVKSDMFEFFTKEVTNRIPGSYIIVSHNGDMSTPDGQDDAPKIGMPRYVVSHILAQEYAAGRLIAHHGQNLWWKKNTSALHFDNNNNINIIGHDRPPFSHCLPIGVENRQYAIGRNLRVYIDALKRNILQKPIMTIEERNNRPLLLIAFYPKSRVPDRYNVLVTIGAIPPKGLPKPTNTWYNETDLSHVEWLDAITNHRFVLAPFGHGLDTHRITEIFLMGGIPVMRRSSISSCYDDSDNNFGNDKSNSKKSRGSLPIVLLNSWKELTKEKLEMEWQRLVKIPIENWDWKRLFINHWLERIGCKN